MQDDTLTALNELIELIDSTGFHVSSVTADEYLAGAGFDPDSVMGTEVKLTVHLPGDEDTDDDNPFKVK